MIEDSLAFSRQVIGAPQLSASEADRFLSGLTVNFFEDDGETDETVKGWFRSMSGASQRLLVRGHSAGFLSDEFLSNELHHFEERVLGLDWSGTGPYASLPEAVEFYDAKLSSVLLAWECLGSSLDVLGTNVGGFRQWVERVLNGYRGVSSVADLRLSTRSEVESLVALSTYVMVDVRVEWDLKLGFDDRCVIVEAEHNIFPMADEAHGMNAVAARVVHRELELLLRGRSLEEYASANRFVRERGVGTSVEEARYVMEHLAVESRALADGFL